MIVFLLILSTAIIKNSAKKIEDNIFTVKENLRVLRSEFEKIKLEHDYLSSSEKLLEFQLQFFEDDLIQKNIENIKVFKRQNKNKKIQDLKITKE
ncbi:cell division protein FtsL [Candidatus Pelagibacter bacterium nBUS_30]|uniref:cell division protein FtsL n=1 Tax=unclassified Candidatus Pelagibacter TaxID=2647897 RepID=UPI003EBBE929